MINVNPKDISAHITRLGEECAEAMGSLDGIITPEHLGLISICDEDKVLLKTMFESMEGAIEYPMSILKSLIGECRLSIDVVELQGKRMLVFRHSIDAVYASETLSEVTRKLVAQSVEKLDKAQKTFADTIALMRPVLQALGLGVIK